MVKAIKKETNKLIIYAVTSGIRKHRSVNITRYTFRVVTTLLVEGGG